jgi:hypothetical protein
MKVAMRAGRRAGGGRTGRRSDKPRWYRVRVDSESGVFLGSLCLDGGGLRSVIDDERAYLPLWNAVHEGSAAPADFVALHKAGIRSVVVVGEDGELGSAAEA